MKIKGHSQRPQTLRNVAEWSKSLADFGMNLRDWQHAVQREGVHSRPEFARRLAEAPPRLTDRFIEGDVADAYLAAYAEWLADRAGIERPAWCSDVWRVAKVPWFSSSARSLLLVRAPGSFRQRDLFTLPEPVFTPRRGRPRVPGAVRREKARLRQKAYRRRVAALLKKAREAGLEP